MRHAGTTLRKIFSDTLRREGGDAPLLAWPLACGTKTAARTTALRFADGVLTIAVPDEVWLQQLQSLRTQYLAALNQISPQAVSRIVFVTAGKSDR